MVSHGAEPLDSTNNSNSVVDTLIHKNIFKKLVTFRLFTDFYLFSRFES